MLLTFPEYGPLVKYLVNVARLFAPDHPALYGPR
jgi:hypothetical protein